jgi:uncharacterized membrane protein YedE/YeeE
MSATSDEFLPGRLPSAAPPAEGAPPAQPGVLVAGVLVAAVLGVAVAHTAGGRQSVPYLIGIALGVVLFHSRFGFTSAWRQLVAVGQGRALRAHMLMLAVGCTLFAPLLAAGVGLHARPQPILQPIGLALVVGAFVFGVGMQLGGSCASGTLYAVGGGQSTILLTLTGFVGGSVLGAAHVTFWSTDVPSGPVVYLPASRLGYGGALVVSLLVISLITVTSRLVERRRRPPALAQPARASGWARIPRGAWPLWTGAVALGGLNAATLFVTGSPWGITSAFALWGSKALGAVGVPVRHWAYWQPPRNAAALHASVLADRVSVMDFGIILGALIASAAAGAFLPHQRLPWRLVAASLLGGVLMGYGARLAGGCNIGAYFSGVASFSLHGWLWGATALVGTFAGLLLRPLFGLTNPKPTDAVC